MGMHGTSCDIGGEELDNPFTINDLNADIVHTCEKLLKWLGEKAQGWLSHVLKQAFLHEFPANW